MSGEQQQPEPKAISSQGAESSPAEQCDRLAETVDVVAAPSSPSTQEADATVLKADQSLQSTVDAPREASAATQRSAAAAGMRYRILKPHAKGGLGEVFVARDQELNRDVALKEIRGEHAHNKDSRGRFLLEAEITGGLEHPGIVPVYGLGQYPDGRPYYAMRFIQGDSLKEAISAYHKSEPEAAATAHTTLTPATERTLQLRKLLGRFIDVCQAIGYAHSRGVLHRDLKPGNIMLGKYGETLVVDWGLAKVQGHDDSNAVHPEQLLQPTSGDAVTPTLAGSALGTPAYMPPEQAAGKLDQLGPQSDVYSLGATLYHLLTGQAPFTGGNLEQTLQAVQSGQFPRPSEVKPDVPKPLEAVCLKAMALKPRDRYASPQDLADDVERYLADEPVQAFPEQFAQRAKRWVRKHPTLVSTTAAIVLISAVGLGTFSSILGAKNTQLSDLNDALGNRNRELAQANTDLDQANHDLIAANERETVARELAETNAQAAREQSQLALATLTSVLGDVQRGLMNLPGGGEVRRNLLITSLNGLQEVATEFVDESIVDHNTLAALNDIGDLIVQFGTGDSQQRSELSELLDSRVMSEEESSAIELARLYYSRARDIARELLHEQPDDVEMQRNLSVSCFKLGDVHLQLGETDSALACHIECVALRERLLDLDPTSFQSRRDLSIACEGLAAVRLRLGDTASAIDLYTRSRHFREELAAEKPDDAPTQRDLAVAYHNLGQLHLRLENASAALELFEKSHEIDLWLAELNPNDTLAQRDLSISYENLGDVRLKLGETEAARGAFENKLAIDERLRSIDPHNIDVLRNLSIAYERMGGMCLLDNQAQAALEFYQKQFQIAAQLAGEDLTNHEKQMWLSTAHEKLGDAFVILGDAASALTNYAACQSIRENIATKVETSSEWQISLAISCNNLGNLHLRLGSFDQALRLLRQSLDICRVCENLGTDDTEVQQTLSHTLAYLGDVHLQLEKHDAALGYYSEQIRLLEEIAQSNPSNVQAQRELWVAYDRLGFLQLQMGQVNAALECFENYREICEVSGNADHATAQQRRDLAICYERLGLAYLQLEDNAMAVEYFEWNVDICEELRSSDPENSQAQRDLSVAYDRLARVHLQMGDIPTAIELYVDSLEIALKLADSDSGNAQFQRDAVVAYYMLGNAKVADFDFEAAVDHYRDAVVILDHMIASNLYVAQSREEREFLLGELRSAEQAAERLSDALAPLESIRKNPFAHVLLPLRVAYLAHTIRFDEIPSAAALLRSLDLENVANLYNAGCAYALCANAIRPAEGETLTREQETQRQECIDLALDCLRESIAAGWSDFEHLQQDPDLAVLRDLPEFEELLHTPPPPPLAE